MEILNSTTAQHILIAFIIGIISAFSLPLGTITSAFWKPGDRAIAFLMAFGGGALLAALTIDLVGSALEKGHFHILALGCIIGSFLFIGLNHIINDHGGFLRKASTTLYYIRRKGRKRFKRILSHVRRIDLFNNLPDDEVEKLASCLIRQEYPEGAMIYQNSDPSNYLFIIENGKVNLLDPENEMTPICNLERNDVFGGMAFFTDSPHATGAVAATHTSIWLLPKNEFEKLVRNTPDLSEKLRKFLTGDEVTEYLTKHQNMSLEISEKHSNRMIQHYWGKELSQNEEQKTETEFKTIIEGINRVPIFQKLPSEEVNKIAPLFFRKQHHKGYTFFHQDEQAERLYIIERGEVEMIDRESKTRMFITLTDYDAFGAMSFLTGAQHTMTAVAGKDTTVWVLQKQDFERLLEICPQFTRAVEDYIKQGEVSGYLTMKQHFDTNQAAQWTHKAVKNMESGKHIPSAREMIETAKEHTGAPIAIWLGIFLDGIPESLVIGAYMIHSSHISLSLIAGLFLSNYPEALSSSVGMRQQGMSFKRVLIMWTSLMIFTGIGAAFGNMFFANAPAMLFSFIEGIAAGAMLTMIAETMLPEAYFKGGSIVGISTLLGFLTPIYFKTME
ncbi:cAMP-binding proteins [Candidatus Scalindua japonica]|uniref:cAMP-binding proteins n=1 Tax=Candidatus Scalindua japonica TaxID=1284222 RepID=A0A286TY47_9BACT|nr:cyclic nucleotide-binding domain-containing protein [Candidatus Scalindua japonica]GAX60812.1 cAMP-binding proteins [Candidatus Scalindua japonica]